MQEALRLVKEELGDEAVILKSEKVAKNGIFDLGGKQMVEIVAAVDPDRRPRQKTEGGGRTLGGSSGYFSGSAHLQNGGQADSLNRDFTEFLKKRMSDSDEPAWPEPEKDPPKGGERIRAEAEKKKAAAAKQQAPARSSKETASKKVKVSQLTSELSELRSLITTMDTRLDKMRSNITVKEFSDMPAACSQEVMYLIENGVDNRIARSLVEKAAASVPIKNVHESGALRQAILEKMAAMITVSGPITCSRGKSRVIAFTGPTGSGKTTTLAKLAANSKFVFNKKVALISADTHRVSALEHLNAFAGASQLPLSAVYSPQELKAALAAHKDKDLIFIDTAGRSPKNRKHMQELQSFLEMAQPTETHLVLPVTIGSLDLLDILKRYDALQVNRVIISKIDEANVHGSILNISAESRNPVSYITTGQTIPDDIELANRKKIARMILRMTDNDET